MKCKHERYNPDCAYCIEIAQCCGFAQKEGYADFDDCVIVYKNGNFRYTKEGWERMTAYYNKCLSIDY